MSAPSPAARGWERGEVAALAALAFLLLVTAAWWALALWPPSGQTPAWLQTARAVCFGAHDGGLPSAGGWILLIGEPIGMLGALFVVWRRQTTSALRRLASSRAGRLAVAGAALLLGAGALTAGARVASARAAAAPPAAVAARAPETMRSVDRPAPPLRLTDQHGELLALERFRGRVVVVVFAYAHCETVCPLIVRDALEVQRRLGPAAPAVVIVTLDPWRDTPARLPHIARRWGVGAGAFVASGTVAEVNAVLDSWGVARGRELKTGEITHAPLAFVVDAGGRLAYQGAGSTPELMELVRRAAGRGSRPAAAAHHEEAER